MNSLRYIMYKHLLLISVMLCLYACHKGAEPLYPPSIDYVYSSTIVFKNESTHVVTISGDHLFYSAKNMVQIESQDEVKFYKKFEYPVSPSDCYGCMVVFDNTTSVFHPDHMVNHQCTLNHCIHDNASYAIEKLSKYEMRYTYTFTDADYDYAVQWNVEHGGE